MFQYDFFTFSAAICCSEFNVIDEDWFKDFVISNESELKTF
jgi:hypothetical protein